MLEDSFYIHIFISNCHHWSPTAIAHMHASSLMFTHTQVTACVVLKHKLERCEHDFPLKMLMWPGLWGEEIELTVITWSDLYGKHTNTRRWLCSVNLMLNLSHSGTLFHFWALSLAELMLWEWDAVSVLALSTESGPSSLLGCRSAYSRRQVPRGLKHVGKVLQSQHTCGFITKRHLCESKAHRRCSSTQL